jgi:hypothetical protein
MSTPVRYALLVLAIPVAIGAYLITARVLSGLELPSGLGDLLVIFLPLFVAGLCSIPLIAPFFDLKARQALADRPGGPPADGPASSDASPDEPRPPRA